MQTPAGPKRLSVYFGFFYDIAKLHCIDQGNILVDRIYEELGAVREPVDLSLVEGVVEAERVLVEQGYKVSQRTDTMVVGERRKRRGLFGGIALYLAVIVRPRPEGGVWIKISGNDREGVRTRQVEWRRWSESLPKVKVGERGDESVTEELTRSKITSRAKAARRKMDNSWDGETDIQNRDRPHVSKVESSTRRAGEEVNGDPGAWVSATPWKRNPKVAPGKSSTEMNAAKKLFDEDILRPPAPTCAELASPCNTLQHQTAHS